MTDPTGLTGASLFALFSQLDTGELPRAYAELLRLFEGANTAAEFEQQTKDVTELLWALKTGRVIDAEQAQAMDAELRTALGAARQRLEGAP